MNVEFSKLQSLGNDFILIEIDSPEFFWSPSLIKKICDRRFGVGSDGLIFYRKVDSATYSMHFFNPDGSKASFCGNGLRCLFFKTHAEKIITEVGVYTGFIEKNCVEILVPFPKHKGKYELSIEGKAYSFDWIDSGVDHILLPALDLFDPSLKQIARKLRSHPFFEKGTNVNFISYQEDVKMRTYERGVEDFTLACGSGAMACFSSLNEKKKRIYFDKERFCDFEMEKDQIKMTASAEKVFSGTMDL